MDNIIDYNMDNHALEKIRNAVASDRSIGLGITGLADALVMMKIKYDTEAALLAIEKMMRIIRDESYKTSIDLAREKGAFPLFDWEGYSQSKFVQGLPDGDPGRDQEARHPQQHRDHGALLSGRVRSSPRPVPESSRSSAPATAAG